jgi:polynucleotide 5'-hydroxyl-kinase GRC3/NOL9
VANSRTRVSHIIVGSDKTDPSSREIFPEPEWEFIVKELIRKRGTVMIIGETDSGKSTLIRHLIIRLIPESISVSLVDADIGQSSLGPPGTICMKSFRDEKDFSTFRFEKMSFLGTTNPALVIPMMIETSRRMIDICRKTSEIILVDTTGLVSGNPGKALKTGKINVIEPEHVIAVIRNDELDHILDSAVGLNIYRIRAAKAVKTRSRRTRTRYRQERLEDYFKRQLSDFKLDAYHAKFFYRTHFISLIGHEFPHGTVIGLNHHEDTAALGIVTACAGGCVFFKSPIRSIKRINKIVLGDIKSPINYYL